MKKIYVVVLILSCSIQVSAKKIEGKIILNNNEIINVVFIVPVGFLSTEPNYAKLQTRVRYIDRSGKKVVLKPDDANEISFNLHGREIRMLAIRDDLQLQSIFSSQAKVFLKLQIDGAVKLFATYSTQNSPGMYNATTGAMTGGTTYNVEKFVLKKNGGQLFRPRGTSFRKDMSEYFSDCPDLVNRIQSRDFRKGDMELIVTEYNKKCVD